MKKSRKEEKTRKGRTLKERTRLRNLIKEEKKKKLRILKERNETEKVHQNLLLSTRRTSAVQ